MKKFLILCFGLVVLGCDSQTVYDGKTFSHWQKELKSKDATGRMRAAAVMNVLGQKARPAVPELIECLEDSNYVVCYEAALALGRIGPAAEPAVPALTKLLKHKNSRVREAAAKALEQIRPGMTISADSSIEKTSPLPLRGEQSS